MDDEEEEVEEVEEVDHADEDEHEDDNDPRNQGKRGGEEPAASRMATASAPEDVFEDAETMVVAVVMMMRSLRCHAIVSALDVRAAALAALALAAA